MLGTKIVKGTPRSLSPSTEDSSSYPALFSSFFLKKTTKSIIKWIKIKTKAMKIRQKIISESVWSVIKSINITPSVVSQLYMEIIPIK